MNEFKCLVKEHGRFQIELKLRYPVKNIMNRYSLQMFIYTPQVLAVDKRNYGTTAFLKDLKVMTRISTPDIIFTNMVREDCEISPLFRIKAELKNILLDRKKQSYNIIYELRTLASIVRVQMRKARVFLIKRIEKQEEPELLENWFEEFCKDLDVFLNNFRDLKKDFVNPDIDQVLRTAYDWADESISLNIQRELGIMHKYCRVSENMNIFCRRLNDTVLNEMKHRKHHNYPSAEADIKKRVSGEAIVYRQSVLKKWSQSVMYLNKEQSFQPERITQIIAGTAAAVAMSFAVAATILTNRYFPQNTVFWGLALVFAYILKDRIKETLRSGLKVIFPMAVADRMSTLKDAAVQKRIGHYKSFVSFHTAENVPYDINKARGMERKPFQDILPSENVILYNHIIRLDGKKIYRIHKRIDSITEIIRLELHKFIQLMDDPDQLYYYSENNNLQKKRLRRVYHINLVTVLADKRSGEKNTYHHRLILNRDGLLRVEHIKQK
ncbi:MAG: hypothetical protein PQJ61_02045 [Spirochaetales bacterium]|uniref:Uncharacterized protein n=1 Tax=Candidatus Thalassospirochaeta sargassi TaxID=3119039 RepID=A0AAJ1MII3_9SPIO|nr:hypothetical protein [Spirochaetales bacterium]